MISLSMITNDAAATENILREYGHHFDKWFITVADKDKRQMSKFKSLDDYSKLNLSYYKWDDHFGKAREFNRKQIDTEYFFWMDSDDEVVGLEHLPEIIKTMELKELHAVYCLYEYMKNDLGEEILPHWRERIVRTNHFEWANNRVHETLIAPAANTNNTALIVVKHNKSKADEQKSMERNIRLLEMDWEETHDPRTAMYLADNYMHLKDFEKAMQFALAHLQTSGSDEDKYRMWLRICDIMFLQDNYAEALNATNAASDILPEYPDAYFAKASIYNAMNQPRKVYEWVKVGLLKPKPQSLKPTDPTLYEYRGLFMGALAALELGKIDEAYKMLQIVRQKSPDYAPAKDIEHIFEEAYYDKEALDKIKWLLYYLRDNGGKPQKLLDALSVKLLSDPRLNVERANIFPPVQWPEKSIAIYCGPAGETWGPDTLEKGMGGSEEAIVYLSRELCKLGWNVTVFNDREEEYLDEGYGGLVYKPWTLLNPNDKYDVFIAWRAPENAVGVRARKIIVDLHDTIPAERVYNCAKQNDMKFMVKSNYHRSLYPELQDDRFVVIGNGIIKEHFSAES